MRLNPEAKMCPGSVIEKKILREAFADVLPSEIAWRQKEQFSDGVGYSWIDTLKKVTAQAVSDTEMANAARRFPINTPQNKEEYFYRTIFEEHCLLHRRSSRLGYRLQEHERPQRTGGERGT